MLGWGIILATTSCVVGSVLSASCLSPLNTWPPVSWALPHPADETRRGGLGHRWGVLKVSITEGRGAGSQASLWGAGAERYCPRVQIPSLAVEAQLSFYVTAPRPGWQEGRVYVRVEGGVRPGRPQWGRTREHTQCGSLWHPDGQSLRSWLSCSLKMSVRSSCLHSLVKASRLGWGWGQLWTGFCPAQAARPGSGPGGPKECWTEPQVPKNSSSSGLAASWASFETQRRMSLNMAVLSRMSDSPTNSTFLGSGGRLAAV